MLFGKDKEFGLVQNGFGLKAIKIGQDGYTIDDVLVHDAHCADDFLHRSLALMDGISLPLAIGVIRDVEAPSYNEALEAQVAKVHKYDNLRDMILSGETWTVE